MFAGLQYGEEGLKGGGPGGPGGGGPGGANFQFQGDPRKIFEMFFGGGGGGGSGGPHMGGGGGGFGGFGGGFPGKPLLFYHILCHILKDILKRRGKGWYLCRHAAQSSEHLSRC